MVRDLTSRSTLFGQAVRFGLMTGLSGAMSLGLPVLLHETLALSPPVAVAISFVLVFFVNFAMLRGLVFNGGRAVGKDLANFGASSLAFRGVEYVGFLLLSSQFNINYVLALATVLALSSLLKFFWYRRTIHMS